MKAVLDFLGNVIQLLTLQTKMGKGDLEETADAKDAYQWLLDEMKTGKSTRVQVHKEPFLHPGKIYVFKYDAKYKNELDYWDKHPIVLVLGNMIGAEGKMIVGINISWYPPTARKYLVEKIREIYKDKYNEAKRNKSFRANEQRPVQLDLYQLKTMLDIYGLSFAIRCYLPQHIKAPKVCICYEDWDKAIKLDQPRIFPELKINNPDYTLKSIYEDFKKYVRYQHNNRADIKQKRDEAKKNQKFKFIK